MLTDADLKKVRPLRNSRKVFVGESLYLLITPRHGRYWRFAYRFGGKQRTLCIGLFYDIPLERARAHHRFARMLLDAGFDPALLKATVGKYAFAAAAREWQRDMDSREPKDPSRVVPGIIDE